MLPLLVSAIISLCLIPAEAGSLKDYRRLVLDGHALKWGRPLAGTGAVVTWALAPGAISFVDARNCRSIAPIDGLLAASRVEAAAFRDELAAAFAGWQAVANIVFRETEPARADILIGAEVEPRGRAFTNVTYDKSKGPPGVRHLTQSVICLNPEERWKIGFDGDLNRYDLRYTLAHEIGHAIGLDHPPGRAGIMDFSYRERYRVLQPGDIAGIVSLYGPARPAAKSPVVANGAPEASRATVAR
jgi:hypothetical protein